MATALIALAPVFALVLLGFLMKVSPFPTSSVSPAAEKLTYYVLFPALLFESLATARLEAATAGPMALALALATLGTAGLALTLKPHLALSGPGFTSFFQGTIRPNTYVCIAIALAVWGDGGVALSALAIAVVVPLVNLLSVAVLARWGKNSGGGLGAFAKALFGNPLILACAAGAAVNLSGWSLPWVFAFPLDLAGKAALVLGLITVGAALEPQRLKADLPALAWVSGFKLAVFPLITAIAAYFLTVPGPALVVAVIYTAVPVSASSYVLASQMGGDKALMAGALTATTILALLTLPAILVMVGT
jgi:predicted permease